MKRFLLIPATLAVCATTHAGDYCSDEAWERARAESRRWQAEQDGLQEQIDEIREERRACEHDVKKGPYEDVLDPYQRLIEANNLGNAYTPTAPLPNPLNKSATVQPTGPPSLGRSLIP